MEWERKCKNDGYLRAGCSQVIARLLDIRFLVADYITLELSMRSALFLIYSLTSVALLIELARGALGHSLIADAPVLFTLIAFSISGFLAIRYYARHIDHGPPGSIYLNRFKDHLPQFAYTALNACFALAFALFLAMMWLIQTHAFDPVGAFIPPALGFASAAAIVVRWLKIDSKATN
jgi:hypothetical protein